MKAPLDYDARKDGHDSYLAAIEAKRLRGDDYYLRQPDDPGVAEPSARPFSWRPVSILFAVQFAIIGAFAWVMWR